MSDTEETVDDRKMVITMGVVVAALLILAVCIGGAARLMGGGETHENDLLMRNALLERIQPVGGVRTSADDMPAAAPLAVADASAAPRSADELVNGVCAACHAAGVGGAPLLGDEAAWAERRELGLDALVASVINGKGSMPARGGSDYSDEEIRLSVQSIAMFEPEEVAAPEATAAPAETTEAAPEAAPAAAPAPEAAPEPAAVPAPEVAPEPESAAPTEDTTTAVAADTTEAPGAAWVVGQAPANLPSHVQTTVDGVCSGCHLAGVAGAHKIGDTAAWEAVAAVGLDALTASVIAGKGVMPPRGGSALTDSEIAIAIQYLVSK
jgi:cytochrome c5